MPKRSDAPDFPVVELHAILLAAGGSARLGKAKQLVEFRGHSLVRRAALLLLALTPRVIVVAGASAAQVARQVQDLDVDLCVNERWQDGVGTSIALAAQGVAADTQAIMVMLCDQYLLDGDDLHQLLEAWRRHPGQITAARWPGAFGPPVIFPGVYLPCLARLSGDRGARQLLLEQREQVHFVDLPHAAHDLDDARGLAQLETQQGREAQGPGV